MEKKYVIEIDKVTKQFKNVFAVKDISLKIRENSIYGLLGPNGCGKSTTMGMILGLITPTLGKIKVLGKEIEKNRSQILQK